MKKMECTFYRPENVNISEFNKIVEKLESDLHFACNDEASDEEICIYAENLIANARPMDGNQEMYFLGLDDPRQMPADARVDYFYRPTYLCSAIIMKAVMKAPNLLEEHGSTIRGLLLGCTGRGFQGHGYDSLKGLIETMRIFAEADCAEFISRYPGVCPQFNNLYWESMDTLQKGRSILGLRNEWGEDYTALAKEILDLSSSNTYRS